MLNDMFADSDLVPLSRAFLYSNFAVVKDGAY